MENRLNVKRIVRIPKPLYDEIAKLAQAKEHSINKEIVALLKAALAQKPAA
jgi:hypothetical protein